MKRDTGQITAFVVVMTSALILLAGLVLDGGLILSARLRAFNEAQEAARSGAQAIDLAVYRDTGNIVLDPVRAVAAANTYLVAIGAEGEARVNGDRVTVTIRRTQATQILAIVGIGSVYVYGSGTAHPVRGITEVVP
ncbi:MAG TPA: pilus assembly protein TadG-related protein [Streptosporangiaceae bacterium]